MRTIGQETLLDLLVVGLKLQFVHVVALCFFHLCRIVTHVRTVERRHAEASRLLNLKPAVLPVSHLAEPAGGRGGSGRQGV